jgi:Transferrin receptor-like dimerisation domain/Peptidase family M28/PA domain
MSDSKTPYLYENLPIPSYEEATSSRPALQSRVGPEEASDDAERQGLLLYLGRSDPTTWNNYEPPSVESARSSLDSLDGIDQGSEDGLRQEMQQMEVEDPNTSQASTRSLLSYRLSKRFTTLTNSFSSLHIPSFLRYFPKISWPQIDFQSVGKNRVVILGRLFGVLLIVGVMYVLLASGVISFSRNGYLGQMYDPESVRIYIQNHMNLEGNIQDYLGHITKFPHVAGTEGSYILGEWIAELFKEAELEDVEMERFDVYLNYPRKDGRRVAIVEPDDQRWEAKIEEDREDSLVFHGHSKSGDVTGPLVYANFGSSNDFQTLADNGISVKDAVVLVRYYGTQTDRALKVKAAEMAGAVGCIIYSDPSQDGFGRGPTFPEGRFMPEDGVQRGTVALTSWVVGDVLSPGWAATPGDKKRIKPEDSAGLNKIPSIPISWRDAKHLIEALKGHGKNMSPDWKGVPNVEYWTGDNKSPQVNLKNIQDEETYQPIYNVLGRITGWEQPDKKVIIGNHRDAWCVGGADPGSGTAVMLEVVRIFGELRRLGWRPLRTIEFASWDAEEYNLVGSTEHVENRMDELRRDGYAYLNVDVGVSGIDFHASASPLFEQALLRVLSRTTDPFSNQTIRSIWEKHNFGIEGLGAGSDHVAFQDIVGTSSIDLSFQGQEYPYHSCYDNFEWMAKFGDQGFRYHKVMGEIWALLILEIADEPLLPFDMEAYARAVKKFVEDLKNYVGAKAAQAGQPTLDLSALQIASEKFIEEAHSFHEWDDAWSQYVVGQGGMENQAMEAKRVSHNNRMANFETHLLDLEDGGGLPNRTQFKHIIFAPQAWSGYDEAYFPGVRDAVDEGNWALAQVQVEKAARILKKAAIKLNGN